MSSDRLERRRQNTRQALLAAAEQLFGEHGLYATTIDEVTAAADVGKGTFYLHFASRDALIAEVVQLGLGRLREKLARALAVSEGVAGRALRVERLIEAHGLFWQAEPRQLLILHQARGWLKLNQPAQSPIRDALQHHLEQVAELLDPPGAAGSAPDPAQRLRDARTLTGMAMGIHSLEQEFTDAPSSEPARATSPVTDTLRELLGRRDEVRSDPAAAATAAAPLAAAPASARAAATAARAVGQPRPAGEAATAPLTSRERDDDEAGPWSADRFRREAGPWLELLRRPGSDEETRVSLLARINALQYAQVSLHTQPTALDRVVVRDAARAWRSLLHPRSESLAGTSLLAALRDAACLRPRPELTPAFWAEVVHLLRAVEGRVQLVRDETGSTVEPEAVGGGRESAVRRSAQLEQLAARASNWMDRYESGLAPAALARRVRTREAIRTRLGGSEQDWSDWHWQLNHGIVDVAQLEQLVALTSAERARVAEAGRRRVPFGVTPYYASLFDEQAGGARDRSLRAQVLPDDEAIAALGCGAELRAAACDYMREADTSPVPLITRRYPAICILKPVSSCPQICVYCQRNWEIEGPRPAAEALAPAAELEQALAWIAAQPGLQEVLVTGGDPLLLDDEPLLALLERLAELPQLERIRLGTRTPVTLPMRFTEEFCARLGRLRAPGRRELALVTHVQHVSEVTPELVQAVERLRRQGVSVYNQLVYTFYASRRFEAAALRRLLRRCGIDPYYTFNTKGKEETATFRVPVARLVQEQKEEARLLPGLARTDEAVFNVPGLGKNPLNAWQHRDLVAIQVSGARLYEFHPWEKKITAQRTHLASDVPILDYLERLAGLGEDPEDYASIWYYF